MSRGMHHECHGMHASEKAAVCGMHRRSHLAMKSESWYARDTMCLVERPSARAALSTAEVMSSEQVAGGSWLMMRLLKRT